MWSVYTIIGYFLLALLIPTVWMALSVRRRTRGQHRVICPGDGAPALVRLDRWHAVRMHALGNPELLVAGCSRWPERARCEQGCRESLTESQATS
jgi:hypothetical protein